MNRIDLIKHILLISAGLIALLWTLYLMVTPLKFALGLILFFITIIVGEMLLLGGEEKPENENQDESHGSAHRITGEFVMVVIFALALTVIKLVPPIRGEIFVEWNALGLPNIIRLIAAFSMNFLPGYLILTIVGSHELGKLPKLVASYFLSFFVLTLVAFVSAKIVGLINELSLDIFFLVCSSLIAVYLLKHLLWRKPRLENESFRASATGVRKTLPALLVLLAVVFIGAWFWWMYSSIGFFIGAQGTDMWRIHSTAQDFLDYRAFNLLQFPWWLNLYLAGFTVLSGAPLANAYVTLFPIIALSVLSFYAMSSAFFKDKRIASLATLSYAIFSGPAWLYALYLRNFSPTIGYDDWKAILYEAAGKFLLQGRYPPFVVGLNGAVIAYAALWWLVYATWQLNLKRKFHVLLMSITFAISYLVHGVDPVIFEVYLIALLIVYLTTGNNEGRDRVKRGALSVLFALGIVTLIDVSLTPEYDYFNSVSPYALASRYFYFNSSSFYILVVSSLSIVILAHGKFVGNVLMRISGYVRGRISSKFKDILKRHLPNTIFYLYGVSLIVFVVLLPSLSIQTTLLGHIPWYVYLVEGGVPTFFGLVAIFIVLSRWSKLERSVRDILAFCALSVLLLFVFGQTVSFINEQFFYTRFWERRTFVYIDPIMSLLMAFGLVTLFGQINVTKPVKFKHIGKIGIVSLLTSLIVIGSVSSVLMSGDFAQSGYFSGTPTTEELEALKFLHYSLPTGSKVAYINQRTGTDFIRAFASDKWSYDQNLWLGQYSRSPSSIIYAIRSLDIQYLYRNRIRDSEDLEKNIFLKQLIKVLPVAFNNSEVTIYSFPLLQAPQRFSSLGVISPRETQGSVYDAYVLWFWTLVMSKYSYSMITNTSDIDTLSYAQTIIMPSDPLQTKEDVGQLIEWVSNGGHLIVSNTNQFGMFAESFGLKTKTSLVDCDSTENWIAAYRRGEISIENAIKVEGNASLRLKNDLSSWEGWVYTPSTPWNLSRYDYLGIWVYGTGGGPIWYLYLTDSNNTASYYRYDLSVYDSQTRKFVPSFTGWKLILIPIKEAYGQLNLSSIKRLHINTGWQFPVNILIDDIFVLEESEGQSFVLTNGIKGEAVNINLPAVEVEGSSFNVDAMVVANYTRDGESIAPFAFQKDFGSGKVTYLDANSIYQFILSESSGLSSPYELLLEILQMIGVSG